MMEHVARRWLCLVPLLVLGLPFLTASLPSATDYPQGYTPAAGETLINPQVTCDGDPRLEQKDTPIGIHIVNSDITLINPEVQNCQTGVWVEPNGNGVVPSNIKIVADKNYPRYDYRRFKGNRTAIRVTRVEGIEIGDRTDSDLYGSIGSHAFAFDDNYKSIYVEGGRNGHIHDTSTEGPGHVWGAGIDEPGSITGILFHGDPNDGPPYDISGWTVERNFLWWVAEESISFDAGNTGDHAMTREQDTVKIVNPANDYLELNSPNWTDSTTSYTGHYLMFTSPGAARGETLEVTSHNGGGRFYVSDPNSVLSGVNVGDEVSVGMIATDNVVQDNKIDSENSRVQIALHGNVFRTQVLDNIVNNPSDYVYSADFNLRMKSDGSGSVHQCLRVSSQSGVAKDLSVTQQQKRSPAMMNTIVGNHCGGSGDLSLHLVTWNGSDDVYDSPNYWANNTFDGGYYDDPVGQLWVHRQIQLFSPPQ